MGKFWTIFSCDSRGSFRCCVCARLPLTLRRQCGLYASLDSVMVCLQAIADVLEDENYDDGSLGPVFIRLAWHGSGSYDKASATGGSNGATIRFSPEKDYGANAGILSHAVTSCLLAIAVSALFVCVASAAGLAGAMARLEPIKRQFPGISYADLYTLAGVVAVEEMGGPTIKWRPGRSDSEAVAGCPPDGRLPDASKGSDHIRNVFYAKGFTDQEIVALVGCHAVGRMHLDRSGFDKCVALHAVVA